MPKPENIIGKGFDKFPEHINRNGRKGKRNRAVIAREILSMKCYIPKDVFEKLKKLYPEIEQQMTNEEIMTIMQVNKAITKEDSKAYEVVLDSAYGKATQQISLVEDMSEDLMDKILKELGFAIDENQKDNEPEN